jgi:glycosyltransferase involved in cell wall biosynthesis
MPPLNILACAYSCDPAGGSERFVGWKAVCALAQKHQVTVMTHRWGREIVEEALPNLPQRDNLRFHYIGEKHRWHPNRLIARFQDWRWLHHWSAQAHRLARDLAATETFDLAHHLTIATWRIPSPLGGLGLPLVWGPVGGGESFPFSFYSMLSPVAQAFELLRWTGNETTLRSRRMHRYARTVSVALGNNPETLAALRTLGIPADRVRYLSQSFLGPDKFINLDDKWRVFNGEWRIADSEATNPPPATRHSLPVPESSSNPTPFAIIPSSSRENPLRIFAGGNLEGRKGVAIALQALSLFGRSGHAFTFTFGGLGPELKHLQKLAARLDFGAGTVSLGHHFDGAQYRAELSKADVYLLPSLREGAPVTMIEAMASGCVPIVANAGGAPMVVDDTCGFVVPITNPEQMAREICSILEKLDKDRELLTRLGQAAWQRAHERCMEDAYLQGVEEAYALALKE